MSQFKINNLKKPINTITIRSNSIAIDRTLTSLLIRNNYSVYGFNSKKIPYINKNNDSKIIHNRKDTKFIRNNNYNFIKQSFISQNKSDNQNICNNQKISTTFSTGLSSKWSSSYPNYQRNITKRHIFRGINFKSEIVNSIKKDCNCANTNFSGEYLLDLSSAFDNKLIHSSNKDITNGSISLNLDNNIVTIILNSDKDESLARIRFRVPIRYRPSYGDWIYNSDITLNNNVSPTEISEIINCCEMEQNELR